MYRCQRPVQLITDISRNVLWRKMRNDLICTNGYTSKTVLQNSNFLCQRTKTKTPAALNSQVQGMFYNSGLSNSEVKRLEEFSANDKPIPPDPETCCETGCVHCVWIKYVEELKNYYPEGIGTEEVNNILKQIHDPVVRSFVKMELGA